ncbi:MAG: ATPase [Clostridia bacterium]|nr:ATPase [Clostridia bacterium]
MKIAVLSGKGGTGKTFVAVNLAFVSKKSTYIDCDVEEPNGRLFFKPKNIKEDAVNTLLPVFDAAKCTGCRKCVDFCKFNALVFIKDKPTIFPSICHSCGGCVLVCRKKAVSEEARPIGVVESGESAEVRVVTGILNPGEMSGVPIIKAALGMAGPKEEVTVIDCPPGSGCSVMESVMDADYCVLVAEPTAFGLHNFKMVYELVTVLGKPCGVIINKTEGTYSPLDEFCLEQNIKVLQRIPYEEKLALIGAKAEIAAEQDLATEAVFLKLLETIRKEA